VDEVATEEAMIGAGVEEIEVLIVAAVAVDSNLVVGMRIRRRRIYLT